MAARLKALIAWGLLLLACGRPNPTQDASPDAGARTIKLASAYPVVDLSGVNTSLLNPPLGHGKGGTDVTSCGANGNVLTCSAGNWTAAAAGAGAGALAVTGYTNVAAVGATGITTFTVLSFSLTTTQANQRVHVFLTGIYNPTTPTGPTSFSVNILIDGASVIGRTFSSTGLGDPGTFAMNRSQIIASAGAHTFSATATISTAGLTVSADADMLVNGYN